MATPKSAPRRAGKKAGKRSNRKPHRSWNIYISRSLKALNKQMSLSGRTVKVLNSFVNDVFERVATEAASIVRANKKRTLDARAVQTALRPGMVRRRIVSLHGVAQTPLCKSVRRRSDILLQLVMGNVERNPGPTLSWSALQELMGLLAAASNETPAAGADAGLVKSPRHQPAALQQPLAAPQQQPSAPQQQLASPVDPTLLVVTQHLERLQQQMMDFHLSLSQVTTRLDSMEGKDKSRARTGTQSKGAGQHRSASTRRQKGPQHAHTFAQKQEKAKAVSKPLARPAPQNARRPTPQKGASGLNAAAVKEKATKLLHPLNAKLFKNLSGFRLGGKDYLAPAAPLSMTWLRKTLSDIAKAPKAAVAPPAETQKEELPTFGGPIEQYAPKPAPKPACRPPGNRGFLEVPEAEKVPVTFSEDYEKRRKLEEAQAAEEAAKHPQEVVPADVPRRRHADSVDGSPQYTVESQPEPLVYTVESYESEESSTRSPSPHHLPPTEFGGPPTKRRTMRLPTRTPPPAMPTSEARSEELDANWHTRYKNQPSTPRSHDSVAEFMGPHPVVAELSETVQTLSQQTQDLSQQNRALSHSREEALVREVVLSAQLRNASHDRESLAREVDHYAERALQAQRELGRTAIAAERATYEHGRREASLRRAGEAAVHQLEIAQGNLEVTQQAYLCMSEEVALEKQHQQGIHATSEEGRAYQLQVLRQVHGQVQELSAQREQNRIAMHEADRAQQLQITNLCIGDMQDSLEAERDHVTELMESAEKRDSR
ncbi:Core histone H2A/H2B/H3/H4, putative [Angomonas deanei]|uniref:Core histone H2A/H2B/H3/H4, putative n=2 Tax=Angomonas deanei TaxID=59799 RepID=A0A7G2CTF8_9TRYP|nr:Core histone H2A/H2B/H3/H4, putative [Angomonas deanei]